MGKMHFCGIHNYGGNLPCPACMGFQVGHAETYGSTRAECDALRSRVSNLSRLLTRCRSELQSILADINAEQIPYDGDDFHELLRDLDEALEPTK